MVKDGELSQHDKCLTIEAQRKDSMTTEECMEEVVETPSDHANLVGLNDAADEFFDVSEPLDYDPSEDGWPTDPEAYAQVLWLGGEKKEIWNFFRKISFGYLALSYKHNLLVKTQITRIMKLEEARWCSMANSENFRGYNLSNIHQPSLHYNYQNRITC